MRLMMMFASLACCLATSDLSMLQQGVDQTIDHTFGDITPGFRGCWYPPMLSFVPSFFNFKFCNEQGESFMELTGDVYPPQFTIGGRINFPCEVLACSPSGGTIILEKQMAMFSKNKAAADDNRGEHKESLVNIDGRWGLMLKIVGSDDNGGNAPPPENGYGVDVGIYPYGTMSIKADVFKLQISVQVIGSFIIKGLRFGPFQWDDVVVAIEIRFIFRILMAEFQFVVSMDLSWQWKLQVWLLDFFGVGNCFQDGWIRRRQWCDHYPRRRMPNKMDQWCWGKAHYAWCGDRDAKKRVETSFEW